MLYQIQLLRDFTLFLLKYQCIFIYTKMQLHPLLFILYRNLHLFTFLYRIKRIAYSLISPRFPPSLLNNFFILAPSVLCTVAQKNRAFFH